jgi:hypothetical protein
MTAAVVVSVSVLAACSGDDGDASPTTVPAATIAVPVTPVTLPDAVTTTPVSTVAPGITATTSPPATTFPAAADTTLEVTQPPSTTLAVVPTTEPLAVQELVLTGEGIGSAVFGADRVDWGVLSLLFTDLSGFANGRRHFIGYEYGRVGQVGDDPVGLRTPGGITLGSRVVDLLAEFPDAVVNPGEPASGFPDNFYVSDVFYGLLTGTTDDDYVTVLFGGYGCGE